MTARYETIAAWVNEFGWTKGAELGVFDGRTLLYLLDHCPGLHLIGVDIWDEPGFKEGPTKSGERCFCQYCSETRASRKARTIAQMKADVMAKAHPTRSLIIVGETAKSADAIKDASLDFVFVDGDHATEGVSVDIAAWKPKIKPGGRIIGHDANMRSVRDGVAAHFAEADIRLEDDHLWWTQL